MTTEVEYPTTPGDVAVMMARDISNLRSHEIAMLRKIDPTAEDYQDCELMKEVMKPHDLPDDRDHTRRWALVILGLALMTPTGSNRADYRTAHNGYMSVGRALFLGDQRTHDEKGFYSEWKFKLLLDARDERERDLLVRMFQTLGSAVVTFNWREMANLIMCDDPHEADRRRLRIADDYHSAPFRTARN